MSIIGSPFPFPPTDPMKIIKTVGKVIGGIGKVAKYAWSVITGKDEKQDEIVRQKGYNPQKDTADEIAELNKLLEEYRSNISSAASDMEREMIVECSEMLQDIMDLFDEYNKNLKVMRSDSVKRKFDRALKGLRGTFAEHVQKRISLDDPECVKVLKLPKESNVKSQRLQEIKQKVFIEAGNEIVSRIKDCVDDFSETVEDSFFEHLERAEERKQEKVTAFEEMCKITDSDGNAAESVMMKANYMLAVCECAEELI